MTVQDWPSVRTIYQAGLDTELATFETSVPSFENWDEAHHEPCRLIAEYDGTIAGWAALAPTSPRYAYRGVAEISIYIDPNASGMGVGFSLLNALIDASEEAGFWTIQSAIFRDNQASIRLHEKCGFRLIGFRERVSERHGVWHDIMLMERRSPTVAASPSAPPDPS